MAEIEVISSCIVGMTRNISMSRIELSPWDLRVLSITYIHRGLIFHKPQSQQTLTLIHHLQNSLSRTLDFFPPLAGRLATTAHDGDMSRFFVDCNNAGAEFRHAVAAAVSVSDIVEPSLTPQIVDSLFPFAGVHNFEGVSTPLLAVQVTELSDGIFIGCATNHAVLDGDSLWHFINSWSQISRGFDTISKLPVFERWFHPNANTLVHIPTLKQTQVLDTPSPSMQKIFHFTKESLGKLKAKANSEAGTDKISTLQAAVAHLWRSTTRCGCRDYSSTQETVLVMCIGVRARLGLPEGYFGNAFYGAPLAMNEAELLQNGLGYAAVKINDLVSQQTEEAMVCNAEENVIIPRWDLVLGSSPRYDMYGSDFGWGKPVAVRSGIYGNPAGMVRTSPAVEAGGIDLEVNLAKETIEALECDAEFMEVFTRTKIRLTKSESVKRNPNLLRRYRSCHNCGDNLQQHKASHWKTVRKESNYL